MGNNLKHGEIITEIEIPSRRVENRRSFIKFGRTNIFDKTIVSVAIVAQVKDKLCQSIRIVFGSISPVPWRAAGVEQMLAGRKIDTRSIEDAVQAVTKGSKPLSMNSYKVDITKVLIKRALLEIAGNR